jgi:8-oxo-dGTP diphosphatase
MKNYSNNIIATLCYIVKDDKVLMLKRVKKENDIHHGKYNGFGGKLEKGETPYECVIREVK